MDSINWNMVNGNRKTLMKGSIPVCQRYYVSTILPVANIFTNWCSERFEVLAKNFISYGGIQAEVS